MRIFFKLPNLFLLFFKLFFFHIIVKMTLMKAIFSQKIIVILTFIEVKKPLKKLKVRSVSLFYFGKNLKPEQKGIQPHFQSIY